MELNVSSPRTAAGLMHKVLPNLIKVSRAIWLLTPCFLPGNTIKKPGLSECSSAAERYIANIQDAGAAPAIRSWPLGRLVIHLAYIQGTVGSTPTGATGSKAFQVMQ